MNKWISVKDQLPPSNTHINFLYRDVSEDSQGELVAACGAYDRKNGKAWLIDKSACAGEYWAVPIYWSPLPEIPSDYEQENCFNKFITELQSLSQKYGVWVNGCGCFEYDKQANYEYVKDYASGDLFYDQKD